MKRLAFVVAMIFTGALLLPDPSIAAQEYLGNLSANPYAPGSTADPAGPLRSESVTNSHGGYGSPTGAQSAANPMATDTPALEDNAGRYRGKLSANPYDADSVSNPYGRYGSAYSPESINNPFGAGNPFAADSPRNPYGQGLRVLAPEDFHE